MSQELINAATRLNRYAKLIDEIPNKSPEAIARAHVLAYSEVYVGTTYTRIEDMLLVTEYVLKKLEAEFFNPTLGEPYAIDDVSVLPSSLGSYSI